MGHALRLGASGFILKDVLPSELVQAIRSVADGDAVIAPSVTRRLLDRFAHQIPDPQGAEASRPELCQLTARLRGRTHRPATKEAVTRKS
jgi:DNA-binding NarL/FixJ family response regulator